MYQISSPQPLQLAGGGLRGNGTVTGVVENSGGVVAPGLSVGVMTISRDYIQGAGASLEIEIEGTGPAEFDHLFDYQSASLAGELHVLTGGG